MSPENELRVIYTDLDGTLLGLGGSLFRSASGGFTLAAARALELCDQKGVELTLVSGRNSTLLREDARILGVRGFIGEAGCLIERDGDGSVVTNCAPFGGKAGKNVFDEIAGTGAPDLLLKHFSEALTYHDPWYKSHEYSHLMRGHIDTGEANVLLAEAGLGDLKVVDNGIIEDKGFGMPVKELHAYHLMPRSAGKGAAIKADLQQIGAGKDQAIACGDSAQDLEMAGAVGKLYLMANALTTGALTEAEIEEYGNVVVVEAPMVEGFLEAVSGALGAGAE